MKKLLSLLGVAAVALVSIASAPAANATANSYLSVAVKYPGVSYAPRTPGETVTVPLFAFRAGIYYKNQGPDAVQVTIEFDLPAGLHWGADAPTAAQGCTSTPTTAICKSPLVPFGDERARDEYYALWDVVAEHAGTYVLRDSVVSSSAPDPDPSDNAATVTAVVKPELFAGEVRLSPARPRGGSTLTARLAFTAGGETVTPESVACTASVARKRVLAHAAAAAGTASCTIQIPRNARRKTIRGRISLSFAGVTLTRRFVARIR